MKAGEWNTFVEKLRKNNYYKDFPANLFKKSCIIYKKGDYGIFLLEDLNGEKYTAKILYYPAPLKGEIEISLYIKEFAAHIPTFLLPNYIYVGDSPINYPLFNSNRDNNMSLSCKPYNIRDIFFGSYNPTTGRKIRYTYYITKACQYNLAQYFGMFKKTIDYNTFVKFTFEFLIGIQTLYTLGIWHNDVKAANLLVCQDNNSYVYIFPNGERRFISSSSMSAEEETKSNNQCIKIIDFGESKIVDNLDNNKVCKMFMNEINVAVTSILNLMWSKTTVINNKNEEIKYNKLISSLKSCETDLISVILNAELFNDLFAVPNVTYIPVKIL